MTLRLLAMRSGVDHSTISRLLSGDRMPSLRTATKLARGLREIHDDADGPRYFAALSHPQMLSTSRVEHALRGDEALTDADVRELLQSYHSIRARRVREDDSSKAPAPIRVA
jgi:transcriptional regulator with XRE-family HTH domain